MDKTIEFNGTTYELDENMSKEGKDLLSNRLKLIHNVSHEFEKTAEKYLKNVKLPISDVLNIIGNSCGILAGHIMLTYADIIFKEKKKNSRKILENDTHCICKDFPDLIREQLNKYRQHIIDLLDSKTKEKNND